MVARRIGKYEVIRPLGQGGMAEVYLVRDPDLDREVALKVIRWEDGEAEGLLTRFHREIRMCVALSHPNLVQILDSGEEAGQPFFTMEYVPGRTLFARVRCGGLLAPPLVVELGMQVGAALQAMHEAGILHRDVKPENVMVGPQDRFVLMDLGLAKSAFSTRFTETGIAVGTPLFMSPEAILGHPVSEASDVFQLGLLLYFSATGEFPTEGAGVPTDFAARAREAARAAQPGGLAALPANLAQVIENATRPITSERYPSTRPVLADLARVRQGKDVRPWKAGQESPEDEPSLDRATLAITPRTSAPPPDRGREGRSRGRHPWGGRHEKRTALLVAGLVLALVAVAATLRWLYAPPAAPVTIEAMELVPGTDCVLVTWRTDRPVPTVLKVWQPRVPEATPLFFRRPEATREHRILVRPLEAEAKYRACVVLPDGRGERARLLRCAGALRVTGPMIRDTGDGEAILEWETVPPARSTLTARHAGRLLESPPEEAFSSRHRTAPFPRDPLAPIESVGILAETAGPQTHRVSAPPIPSVPDAWLAAARAAGTDRLREDLLGAVIACVEGRNPQDAHREIDRVLASRGLAAPFARFLPVASRYFADGRATAVAKADVYGSLHPFLLTDQLCVHFDLAPRFRLAEAARPFVAVAETPWLPTGRGHVVVAYMLPAYEDLFFPANLSALERDRLLEALRVFVAIPRTPHQRLTLKFGASQALLDGKRHAQLSARVANLYRNYYFHLALNGRLELLVVNPHLETDLATKFRHPGAEESSLVSTPQRTMHYRFPAACLRTGDNELTVTLYTLAGKENLLPSLLWYAVMVW